VISHSLAQRIRVRPDAGGDPAVDGGPLE
jgi:hypothetical protein